MIETIKRRIHNAFHNCIVHPVAGVFWLVGFQKAGDYIHDIGLKNDD